ncbi:MAG: hypothetical protein IIX61_10190 [Loktanella sp.]|nr:hypothetical protein [Loktanella sp.]
MPTVYLRNAMVSAALTAAAIAAAPSTTAQEVLDTRSLFDACTLAEESWISFCNGYIQAAADIASLGGSACIPLVETRANIASNFAATMGPLLVDDSSLADENGLSVMLLFLSEAYPC